MAKVLIVDDDVLLCKNLSAFLKRENHTIEVVHSGNEAIDRLKYESYDAVILDWELPDINGPEVSKRYRASGGNTPILMLTGKDQTEEMVEGLDAGADDYITKPFKGLELCARIRALTRRQPVAISNTLKLGNIEVDTTSGTVKINGVDQEFYPKEVQLLEFFMKHENHHFSADVLLDRLWSSEKDVTVSTIRTYIAKLRGRLEASGANVSIGTKRKYGYFIEGPDR